MSCYGNHNGRPCAHLQFSDLSIQREVSDIFVNSGYDVTTAQSTLSELDADSHAIVVFETGDDAARLVMNVFDLLTSQDNKRPMPPIIGILSPSSTILNPSVTRWLIDGHAALLSLQEVDDSLLGNLRRWAEWIKRDYDGRVAIRIIANRQYEALSGKPVQIGDLLDSCVSESQLYRSNHDMASSWQTPASLKSNTVVEVTKESVLASAARLSANFETGEAVCLSFACPHRQATESVPSSDTQEDSLLRSTGLLNCLSKCSEMYEANIAAGSSMFSDDIIYSPRVPVFRDGTNALLEQPYCLSIISAAAINARLVQYREPQNVKLIHQVLRRRLARVLWVAANHGHNTIILGAWGCGGGGNDPNLVADVFACELLDTGAWKDHFRRVIFAIDDRSEDAAVINAFLRRFSSDL